MNTQCNDQTGGRQINTHVDGETEERKEYYMGSFVSTTSVFLDSPCRDDACLYLEVALWIPDK